MTTLVIGLLMKTRWIAIGLLVVAAVLITSTVIAYRVGYRHGGEAELACWTLDPPPAGGWSHGEITAHRDIVKHPLLPPARLVVRVGGANSVPLVSAH